MRELEKYISDNIGYFDSEPVPEGSKARFMAALSAEKKKRRMKVTRLSFFPAAAVLAVFVTLSSRPDFSRELQRHHKRLAEKECEILALAERDFPHEARMLRTSIRSITHEAIPLEAQLPEEMPEKEKRRILNDYYNRKHAALECLLAYYYKE